MLHFKKFLMMEYFPNHKHYACININEIYNKTDELSLTFVYNFTDLNIT